MPAGSYVFADDCSGEIFQRVGAGKALLLSTGFFVASFGEDEAGEIYVVDHGGAVYRLAVEVPPCSYSIDPPAAAFPAAARSATVSVTTTEGCAWAATSHDSWIVVGSGGSGAGSGTVQYTVAANPGMARAGTLTIADQTLTVNQWPHSWPVGRRSARHWPWSRRGEAWARWLCPSAPDVPGRR